jgi:hypothetical protein
MRFAFLLLAHHRPLHLLRLSRALLESADDRCFIHVDAKTDITPFREPFAAEPQTTLIEPRRAIHWGGFGLVEATMDLIRSALAAGRFKRLALLSVGCYPARSIAALRERCAGREEFCDARPVAPGSGFEARYERYHLMDHEFFSPRSRTPPQMRAALEHYVAEFLDHIGARPEPPRLPVYSGSTWWVLSARAARHVVEEFDHNPYWRERFRYTRVPEEVVIPSILGNSRFRRRLAGHLHYIDWSVSPGPKMLDASDFKAIVDSGCYFARKLDVEHSGALFDLLDRRRRRER